MFGLKKKKEKERLRIEKYKQKQKEIKLDNEFNLKQFKLTHPRLHNKKDTFGPWIIKENGYTSYSTSHEGYEYNHNNYYHCIHAYTGETKIFNEQDISLIKEVLN